MKKYIIFCLISIGSLLAQDLSMMNPAWRLDDHSDKIRFALNIGSNIPMHLYAEKYFNVNDNFNMKFGAVLSSENDIGATLERQDFPLFSTGRFYQGEINYSDKNFDISLGRHVYDQDPVIQNSIWKRDRITGDGIVWSWKLNENLSFHHSAEFLPEEKDTNEQIFDRILNYHSLKWQNERWEITAGEICLYTGIDQGLNWHLSNPFVPYLFHYAEGYEKVTPGYSGDNENIILTLGLKVNILRELFYQTRLYIDDIQIDKADRERIADTYLWYNELYWEVNSNFRTSFYLNLSNPAMGWHSGPFTSLLVFGEELLPQEIGEVYSFGMKLHYRMKKFETYFTAFMIEKALVDLKENYLYLIEIQNNFEKVRNISVDAKAGYYLFDNFALWIHYAYSTDSSSLFNLILQACF